MCILFPTRYKTPMINGFWLDMNIILNIVLSKYMGLGGLALAKYMAIFCTVLLFISLEKVVHWYETYYHFIH